MVLFEKLFLKKALFALGFGSYTLLIRLQTFALAVACSWFLYDLAQLSEKYCTRLIRNGTVWKQAICNDANVVWKAVVFSPLAFFCFDPFLPAKDICFEQIPTSVDRQCALDQNLCMLKISLYN